MRQQLRRSLYAKPAAVNHQIPVGKGVPEFGTVASVVQLPGTIHLPDHFLRRGFIHSKLLCKLASRMSKIRSKNVKRLCKLQNLLKCTLTKPFLHHLIHIKLLVKNS